MNRNFISLWCLLGTTAAIGLGLALIAQAPLASPAQSCCFANDAYEGVCTVTPGQGETCGSILAYLNNPLSTGKSYCNGSAIRGGWVRVDCRTGKPIVKQDPGD
jgi:hypothetical protein